MPGTGLHFLCGNRRHQNLSRHHWVELSLRDCSLEAIETAGLLLAFARVYRRQVCRISRQLREGALSLL